MGDGYKRLMSLYNLKRKEAAVAHDDELIEYYMGKMAEPLLIDNVTCIYIDDLSYQQIVETFFQTGILS